jgi:cobyrinic acid a,c-diamide synthase
MLELMLAAPASGSGKTVLTCALLGALKKRGYDPCAFKCGPDYIDPMFHRTVLGVDGCNLDLFLSHQETVRSLYARYRAGHGAAVVEGAMGFYDGLGGTRDQASAWHVADTLDLPVLLVVRPKGASLTLAAQIQGLQRFRANSHIVGILLNDCTPMLAQSLAPMLQKETGLPVVGSLPHLEQAVLESRHLGLCTAGEIQDLQARLDHVARQLEQTMDWALLAGLCQRAEPEPKLCDKQKTFTEKTQDLSLTGPSPVVAAASDKAFCFTYRETLDALRQAGAELAFFSPLEDERLPEGASALYLPGGYPELYAAQLSENHAMRQAIQQAVAKRMPTVAECGGFLYLGKSLQGTDGEIYPMVSALPGEAIRKERLVRFGYAELTARGESLLFRSGERVPIHEFHYWDSSENGADLTATKPLTGRSWSCGFASERLYAAFPHLYFAGHPQLARRFVEAARQYEKERNEHGASHSGAGR